MTRSTDNPWLHRFAVLTAAATLVLIGIGGLVTSHGVGMSVPDWPTTYGYNMFFFPFSKWVGGVFYEHSHRLVASAVGFLTTILAVWLWLKEERSWLRWLGVAAWFGVVLQGVLGGLRVRWMQDELGVFHAALAQLFFVLVCSIALFTSKGWSERSWNLPVYDLRGLRYLYLFATVTIFLQLILGATMRHQHAGLAIPDFPLAYGKVWPSLDAASVAHYNQGRDEATALNPITAFQVGLQMAHRIVAVLIFGLVSWAAMRAAGWRGQAPWLTRLSLGWLGLILVQLGLGMVTIWTNKSADIATAHVLVGALSLWMGSLLSLLLFLSASRASALVTATVLESSVRVAPRPVKSLT